LLVGGRLAVMTATLTDPRPSVPMSDAGGPTTQLWELPDAGHTGGLRTHPAEYERRTTTFLDRALGLKETS
jgi:hypothetical protein